MKLLEYEAKEIFINHGIAVPDGVIITQPEEMVLHLHKLGPEVVLKAQVDVGGRGKAGGILMAKSEDAMATANRLFGASIKGMPVDKILVEERLPIEHEYYLSITIDRASKQHLILFAETGGVDIEQTASLRPEAVRKALVHPLLADVPPFLLRRLVGNAPKEIAPVINRLYHVFCEKDALLAEINPLVTTPDGVFAADAKLIIDDNALARQGIHVNRDQTEREREAERHGFSYVELAGSIGVIGNGAGLTMATLDLIEHYRGRAANFLDVGGGAGRERVTHAVRLVAGMPEVQVIVVNLLGGITRCDEVAEGIVDANIPQKVIVRLAGTNEEKGRNILQEHGYMMLDTMEEAVRAAVEAVQ
ncbi:MAG: ADP-forming succinate--CoA ligase subunit beta [Methanomicrobiaceae archaeon]|nr:ADP-forming succinate--CoA ligase subunit beta [Methanomicrobiaceae archaeon]